MKNSTKWIYAILFLVLLQSAQAWNIGSKGRVNGPSIHSTYFTTPNNASYPVRAQAYVGMLVNGSCQYNAVYDLGSEEIRTGDVIDFDAFRLKSTIGMGYTCMTIFYTLKQIVMETIELNSDGINYVSSDPATSEIAIM